MRSAKSTHERITMHDVIVPAELCGICGMHCAPWNMRLHAPCTRNLYGHAYTSHMKHTAASQVEFRQVLWQSAVEVQRMASVGHA